MSLGKVPGKMVEPQAQALRMPVTAEADGQHCFAFSLA